MSDGDGAIRVPGIDTPKPKQITTPPSKIEGSSSAMNNMYPFGFGGAKSLRLSEMNSFDIPSVPCIFASPRARSPSLSRQLTRHPSWDLSNTDFSLEDKFEVGSSSDYRKNEFSGSLRRYGFEHVNYDWIDSQMEFDQDLLDWARENQIVQSDSESMGIDTSDVLLDSPNEMLSLNDSFLGTHGLSNPNLVEQATDQIAPNSEYHQNQKEDMRIDTDGLPNLHCDSRRRCLFYETTGSSPMDLGDAYPDSITTDISNVNTKSADKLPNLAKTKSGSSSSLVSGIGTHLNSLVPIPSPAVSQDSHSNSLVPLPCSAVGQDSNDALVVSGEQEEEAQEGKMSQNNWRKKRRRLGNDELEGCKRCNCKKSKCLKLYCECFAAGLYCIDSACSCQGCFNKPIHVDMVIETRNMIVSRNPLAFAPKVAVTENGKVNSSRTPASARHKRGCNCRKSNCLKKYCECYQSGVGCSIDCRCDGCKNPMGRKDGGSEEEETILPNNAVVETILPNIDVVETILPNNAVVEIILPNNAAVGTILPNNDEVGTMLPNNAVVETMLPNNPVVGTGIPNSAVIETILPNNVEVETILPNNMEYNQDSQLCPTPLKAVRGKEKTQSPSCAIKQPFRLSNLSVIPKSSYNVSKRVGKENMCPPQPMLEKQLETVQQEDKVPQVLNVQFSPGNGSKTSSSPPYNAEGFHSSSYRSGRLRLSPSSTGKRRKIILQSIPLFPPLTPKGISDDKNIE